MNVLNETDLKILIVQAESGDETAVRDILRYYCDCMELDIPVSLSILWFIYSAFDNVLDDESKDSIFQFRPNKRKLKNTPSRDYLLALNVLYEYKVQGLSLEKAIHRVANRDEVVSDSVVERAWKKYRIEVNNADILSCLSAPEPDAEED